MSLEFAHAVDCAALGRALCAPALGLVRAKGLMRNQDDQPCVLQVVGARAAVAPSAHSQPDNGRLVCIGLRGQLDRAAIADIVFRSKAGSDDNQASTTDERQLTFAGSPGA